jgi:hypothetical protein
MKKLIAIFSNGKNITTQELDTEEQYVGLVKEMKTWKPTLSWSKLLYTQNGKEVPNEQFLTVADLEKAFYNEKGYSVNYDKDDYLKWLEQKLLYWFN